ncbi:MAG: glutathione S-transferase family protein [Pseudomonadota bacterium]
MTLTIYSVSGAPRPWRVLLALTFKALAYETVLLRADEKEHKSEPFLSLNPRGTVPVLTDGTVVIRDSLAAMAWLDRAFPDHPLFGTTPEQAARLWQHTTEISDYLRTAITGVLQPVFFEGADSATPALLAAAKVIRKEVAFVENLIASGGFIDAQTPGAADAVAFPEIRLLQRAIETKPAIMTALGLHETYKQAPNLAAWVSRIETLPGYDLTRPPHWRVAA